MDRFEIVEALVGIAKRVLKVEVGPESTSENTPNWDSLRHVEIVFAAEEALDVEFPADSLTKLKSIGALADAATDYLRAA